MFGRLLPQELGFFEYFKEGADVMSAAMKEFCRMLDNPHESESRATTIKEYEHQGDEITHKTMTLLHSTFITPLDREYIYMLVKSMDDVIDFIDASAQRIYLYQVTVVPENVKKLGKVTLESVELLKRAVALLPNLKNTDELRSICIEINRLENQADHIMRTSVAQLFHDEPDIRMLIKLKEIYELLETVTDRCEDVANVIESIVLEHV
jgi:predicted phosphate transport protein (TIGR00153 family)